MSSIVKKRSLPAAVMMRVVALVVVGATAHFGPAAVAAEQPMAAPGGSRTIDPVSITDSWVVPPVLATGTRLPVPADHEVTWTVDGVALPGGVLVNAGVEAKVVRIAGTLMRPDGGKIEKRFTVRLLGKAASHLLSYARVPTSAHDANQPEVARSVHFALRGGDRAAAPLNDDYGAVFARGDYVAVDRVALRGTIDPSLFYFADGSLGIIATRVDMAGKVDPPSTGTILFKADRAHPDDFAELGPLDLRTTEGVGRPRAVWDAAANRYVVSWINGSGKPRWTTVKDLARTERHETPFFPETDGRRSRIVSAGNVGEVRSGDVATIDGTGSVPHPGGAASVASSLPIDGDAAAALHRRFGRIVNVAASVAPQTVTAGRVAALQSVRAKLDYSDGSHATRAVDWNVADLRRLARARPGKYVVRGTVRQPAYPPIFAYNRADPDVYRWERNGKVRYLFVATDDTNNGNVSSPHLPIRVADTIAQLADEQGGRAREVDLLNRRTRRDRTTEGRVIAGCYWAPELHEIGGKLSILFAPCFNPKDDQSNENGTWVTVQSHIMQLRDGGDPANAADWSKPSAVRKADGSFLGRPDKDRNISLDMSYFEVGDQAYYTWSQRYLTDAGPLGDPLTWIAKVDPSRPTSLASVPTPIIAPDLSVEENLAEGAFALQHGNRVTLVYSSSSVSPTYVVGGVSADRNADLTRIDSWRKWRAPLQKSAPMPTGVVDYRRYEQGPGHGSFTTDEDRNALYVYHTWGNGVGGDGRDTRVRRVHWAADGRPLLDMTAGEEVAPANRSVTMTVTVR